MGHLLNHEFELFTSQIKLLHLRHCSLQFVQDSRPNQSVSPAELRILQDIAASGSYIHPWPQLQELVLRRVYEIIVSYSREAINLSPSAKACELSATVISPLEAAANEIAAAAACASNEAFEAEKLFNKQMADAAELKSRVDAVLNALEEGANDNEMVGLGDASFNENTAFEIGVGGMLSSVSTTLVGGLDIAVNGVVAETAVSSIAVKNGINGDSVDGNISKQSPLQSDQRQILSNSTLSPPQSQASASSSSLPSIIISVTECEGGGATSLTEPHALHQQLTEDYSATNASVSSIAPLDMEFENDMNPTTTTINPKQILAPFVLPLDIQNLFEEARSLLELRLLSTDADGAPLSLQRICEVLISPRRYYSSSTKLLRALILLFSSQGDFTQLRRSPLHTRILPSISHLAYTQIGPVSKPTVKESLSQQITNTHNSSYLRNQPQHQLLPSSNSSNTLPFRIGGAAAELLASERTQDARNKAANLFSSTNTKPSMQDNVSGNVSHKSKVLSNGSKVFSHGTSKVFSNKSSESESKHSVKMNDTSLNEHEKEEPLYQQSNLKSDDTSNKVFLNLYENENKSKALSPFERTGWTMDDFGSSGGFVPDELDFMKDEEELEEPFDETNPQRLKRYVEGLNTERDFEDYNFNNKQRPSGNTQGLFAGDGDEDEDDNKINDYDNDEAIRALVMSSSKFKSVPPRLPPPPPPPPLQPPSSSLLLSPSITGLAEDTSQVIENRVPSSSSSSSSSSVASISSVGGITSSGGGSLLSRLLSDHSDSRSTSSKSKSLIPSLKRTSAQAGINDQEGSDRHRLKISPAQPVQSFSSSPSVLETYLRLGGYAPSSSSSNSNKSEDKVEEEDHKEEDDNDDDDDNDDNDDDDDDDDDSSSDDGTEQEIKKPMSQLSQPRSIVKKDFWDGIDSQKKEEGQDIISIATTTLVPSTTVSTVVPPIVNPVEVSSGLI